MKKSTFWVCMVLLAVAVTALVLLFSLRTQVRVSHKLPLAAKDPLPHLSPPQKSDLLLKKINRDPNPYQRCFLVSDIHGRFKSLISALERAGFSKADQLTVLGDTIDRGPEGFKALLWLNHVLPSHGYHVRVLLGNHEEMWLDMANQGETDQDRLSALNGFLGRYKGSVPNGWEVSREEWKELQPVERSYLLTQMGQGFGQPRLLVEKIGDRWVTMSHTINLSKPFADQTVEDVSWYNPAWSADGTFQEDLADQLQVKKADVQVFIGHIGGLRFGKQIAYIDLDNTDIRNFYQSPGVEVYEVDNGKWYQGEVVW